MKKKLIIALLPGSLALATNATASAYKSKTYNGNIGDQTWSAFISVDYYSKNGGYGYRGVGKTDTSKISTLHVTSKGSRRCGFINLGTDWNKSKTRSNVVGVAIYPPHGWSHSGICHFWGNICVSNDGYHKVITKGGDRATKRHYVCELLPS